MESSPLLAPLGIAFAVALGGLLLWMRRRSRPVPDTVVVRAAERRAQRVAEREAPAVAAGPDTETPVAVPHRRTGIEVADLSGGVVDIDELLADISRSERQRQNPDTATPPDTSASFGASTMGDMIATIGGTTTGQGEPAPDSRPGAGVDTDTATRRWQQAELLEAASTTIPLPDLVLAWCEARGYRVFEASRDVLPIRAVLRHKKDPSRVYAYVVEDDYVDRARLAELRKRAEDIGLMRMMIVTLDGHQLSLAQGKEIRLIDRAAMEHQLHRLDLRLAAKIVSVARRRTMATALE